MFRHGATLFEDAVEATLVHVFERDGDLTFAEGAAVVVDEGVAGGVVERVDLAHDLVCASVRRAPWRDVRDTMGGVREGSVGGGEGGMNVSVTYNTH